MSVLIVKLPLPVSGQSAGAAPDYSYVRTRDGQAPESHGTASAATLPSAGVATDIVALVPFQALSWHLLELPKGTLNGAQTRLRAVLDGLLEDRLLDEPASVHLAVSPLAKPSQAVWVAACDKAWLKTSLAPLEAAGRPVSRIVPELAPIEGDDERPSEIYAVGDPEQGWLVRCDAQGILALPMLASSVQALAASTGPGTSIDVSVTSTQVNSVFAEPAAVATAEALLGRQPQLQQASERWVRATLSAWDLAQFDLANSGRQRSAKKLGDAWRKLIYGPQWRAARWGALGLILVHVLGLNVWAWKEKSELTAQRAEIRNVLTQTFPQVKLVVDAPIQMARELTQLRQSAGASSGQDLEPLLSALGMALPPNPSSGIAGLRALDYAEGELRLKGLSDDTANALRSKLEPQGYMVRAESDSLLVKMVNRP